MLSSSTINSDQILIQGYFSPSFVIIQYYALLALKKEFSVSPVLWTLNARTVLLYCCLKQLSLIAQLQMNARPF